MSCKACKNTGKCQTCDGAGTVSTGRFTNAKKCETCGGKKACGSCGGKG